MEEDWKVVPGTDGSYWVSNLGEMWSCRGKMKGTFMKTHLNDLGYCTVKLTRPKGTRVESVHRLVAKAFVDGYRPWLVVDHVDSVRNNNRADNLEWVTQADNLRRAYNKRHNINVKGDVND